MKRPTKAEREQLDQPLCPKARGGAHDWNPGPVIVCRRCGLERER